MPAAHRQGAIMSIFTTCAVNELARLNKPDSWHVYLLTLLLGWQRRSISWNIQFKPEHDQVELRALRTAKLLLDTDL